MDAENEDMELSAMHSTTGTRLPVVDGTSGAELEACARPTEDRSATPESHAAMPINNGAPSTAVEANESASVTDAMGGTGQTEANEQAVHGSGMAESSAEGQYQFLRRMTGKSVN